MMKIDSPGSSVKYTGQDTMLLQDKHSAQIPEDPSPLDLGCSVLAT